MSAIAVVDSVGLRGPTGQRHGDKDSDHEPRDAEVAQWRCTAAFRGSCTYGTYQVNDGLIFAEASEPLARRFARTTVASRVCGALQNDSCRDPNRGGSRRDIRQNNRVCADPSLIPNMYRAEDDRPRPDMYPVAYHGSGLGITCISNGYPVPQKNIVAEHHAVVDHRTNAVPQL